MVRSYHYVGPAELRQRVLVSSAIGTCIHCQIDFASLPGQGIQARDSNAEIVTTFVVDEQGVLRMADRRSEHVVCAGGQPVLAAGELSFIVSNRGVEILWITNQSTGYCPEPACWPAVASALRRAGIESPDGFFKAFDYRRCTKCQTIAIVKDGLLRCEVCRAKLPEQWNLAADD